MGAHTIRKLVLLAACVLAGAVGARAEEEGKNPPDSALRLKELEAQEASLAQKLNIPGAGDAVPVEENHEAPPPPPVKKEKAAPEQNSKTAAVKGMKGVKGKEKVADKENEKEKASPQSPIQRAVEGVQEATKSVQQENLELRDKYAASQKSLSALQEKCGRISDFERRAADSEDAARRLARELDETRGRLMVVETQLERMTARYGGRPDAAQPQHQQQPSQYQQQQQQNQQAYLRGDPPVDLSHMPGSIDRDMPLATVVTESANLRTGPGDNYSTLMTVPKGESLAVEGRQGEWLKVITPLGARAWINGASLRVGGGAPQRAQRPAQAPAKPAPPRSMAPFSDESEDAAFSSITGGLKTK